MDEPKMLNLVPFDEYVKEKNIQPHLALVKVKVEDELLPMLKNQFLTFFEQCGLVEEAAIAVGVSASTVYEWRMNDIKFADEWDNVRRNKLAPLVEDILMKRAMSGKSDLALIFLLKSMKPDIYDDKARLPPPPPGLVIQVVDVGGKLLADTKVVDVDLEKPDE